MKRPSSMAAAVCIVGLFGLAGPAAACLPPPPPAWGNWLGDPSVPMFLGRVDRVDTQAPVEVEGLIVTRGLAHISLVEVIQGAPSQTSATAAGVLSVAYTLDYRGGPPCIDYLNVNLGNLVVVVEGGGIHTLNSGPPPSLAKLFEKYR